MAPAQTQQSGAEAGPDTNKADKSAGAATGSDGDELCERVWRAADKSGGSVENRPMHPITRRIVHKIDDVAPARQGEYVVLCGVNRSDGTETAAADEEKDNRKRKSVVFGRVFADALSGFLAPIDWPRQQRACCRQAGP